MRKIPTLFRRDPEDRARVTAEVNPGCEWVLAGEGVATRKYDGTCVRLDESGAWWARREVKPGKAAPAGYLPVETDPVTGKTMGWEPMAQSPFAKFHAEALQFHAEALDALESHAEAPADRSDLVPGTYELVGPKLNGNPERRTTHGLVRHAEAEVLPVPQREHAALRDFVLALAAESGAEGLVFHHPDGRMAKLKARDFG
ncbi:DUF5565 family protein [Kitasatospora viridis]|uniref:ATP dependent DNA ligase-like protein n=1 Tax=Kitasatospora viridis TaxID=281105 RepID=A0A561UQ67_9ACTN|nr:DUF5565 family protein [Kitasatospora viridis]TWG01523.1 hypothetical protein FHX73_115424 [Kitasatospora viridis]